MRKEGREPKSKAEVGVLNQGRSPVLDRVVVEFVKERERFSRGKVKNVSVKGAEEATISANEYDMDRSGQM